MTRYEVGLGVPKRKVQRGIYTGSDPLLSGKTAYIVRENKSILEHGWLVQTDDVNTGFGYGWWWFPLSDWRCDVD